MSLVRPRTKEYDGSTKHTVALLLLCNYYSGNTEASVCGDCANHVSFEGRIF
jgi:hypothetical protein